MKDKFTQKKNFILCSFSRLKIPSSPNVYKFCDHLIESGWEPPLDCLTKVDNFIREQYHYFLQR